MRKWLTVLVILLSSVGRSRAVMVSYSGQTYSMDCTPNPVAVGTASTCAVSFIGTEQEPIRIAIDNYSIYTTVYLDMAGNGSFTTPTSLASGTHTITAYYWGFGTENPPASWSVSLIVTSAPISNPTSGTGPLQVINTGHYRRVQPRTVTFSVNGIYTWTVPAGITSLTVAVSGAGGGGGSGGDCYWGTDGNNGGDGSPTTITGTDLFLEAEGGGGGSGGSGGDGLGDGCGANPPNNPPTGSDTGSTLIFSTGAGGSSGHGGTGYASAGGDGSDGTPGDSGTGSVTSTPGQTLTITVGGGGAAGTGGTDGSDGGSGSNGSVTISW